MRKLNLIFTTLLTIVCLVSTSVYGQEEEKKEEAKSVPEVPELPEMPEVPELPKAPEIPEVKVEPPKFLEKVIEGVSGLIGLSSQDKKNKEAKKINASSLHQAQLAYYKKTQTNFIGLSNKVYTPKIDSLEYTVMGWHPFWVEKAYKNYSYGLLSDISFYAVELNKKTGNFVSIQNWNKTPMIDIAKSHGCKVHVTMTLYDRDDIHTFLKNRKAQYRSIKSLMQLLKFRNGNGVTLDMTPIASNSSKNLTKYVNMLATVLHKGGYKLNLVLPPVLEPNTYDIENLKNNIDLFIVMGYGYNNVSGRKAGPLTALATEDKRTLFALDNALDDYVEKGLPIEKSIVSLSYLGSQWDVANPVVPSDNSKFLNYIPIQKSKELHEKYNFKVDEVSGTPVVSFPNEDKTFNQIWMDDPSSFQKKLQLVKKKGFQGVALWCLGYDNGTSDYWKLIEKEFAVPKPPKKVPTVEEPSKKEKESTEEVKTAETDSISQFFMEKLDKISEKVTQLGDLIDSSSSTDSLLNSGETLKKEVFGWHPYWSKDRFKNYNFNLLTTLAYFSYEINPKTGGYKTIHDWETTKVVDSARAKGTKVHLTATSLTKKSNRIFLNSRPAQSNFIDEIIKQVKSRTADGVNIDFEQISKEDSERFTVFVINLSTRLQQEGLEFSMALPARDPEHVYDIKNLVNYVDYFVMMGYDYHTVKSPIAGPVAPLRSSAKWGEFSIENSVNTYFSRGMPLFQLIVAFPYYGISYETYSVKIPSLSAGKAKERIYSDIKNLIKRPPKIDNESTSAYHLIPSPTDTGVEQVWFDNEESFSLKCDWVNQKKLKGVGIWALGYDHGNNEMWTVLNNKFAKDPNSVALTNPTAGDNLWHKVKHILNDLDLNSNALLILLFLFLAVLSISFLLAVLNSQVIDILFHNKLYQAGFIILFLLLVVSVLELKNLISKVEVLFFLGALLGIGITFFLRRKIEKSEKKTP